MILETLARRYGQLYLIPGKDSGEAYRDVVSRGKEPPRKSLEIFKGNENDRLMTEHTPVGEIETVFLNERCDFENFIRIMSYRCENREIPANTGAMTISGIINRNKINSHRLTYMLKGGTDWDEEFKRFTADKNNYCDTVIVLSNGYYSNIPENKVGLSKEEWIEKSYTIRLYHECTHVVCRRKYPDKKHAVFDEVLADAIGLVKAFGHYDTNMASLFLGVSESGYTGGRLENYISVEETDKTAKAVSRLINELYRCISGRNEDIYDTVSFVMEEKYDELTGVLGNV